MICFSMKPAVDFFMVSSTTMDLGNLKQIGPTSLVCFLIDRINLCHVVESSFNWLCLFMCFPWFLDDLKMKEESVSSQYRSHWNNPDVSAIQASPSQPSQPSQPAKARKGWWYMTCDDPLIPWYNLENPMHFETMNYVAWCRLVIVWMIECGSLFNGLSTDPAERSTKIKELEV